MEEENHIAGDEEVELKCTLLYFGPPGSGKKTILKVLHEKSPQDLVTELRTAEYEKISITSYEYTPFEINIKGKVVIIEYMAVSDSEDLSKMGSLIWEKVDAIVFVPDCQRDRTSENMKAFLNLNKYLKSHNRDPREIPLVMQYNKVDMINFEDLTKMNSELNTTEVPWFESIAIDGAGIFAVHKKITIMLLAPVREKYAKDFYSEEISITKDGSLTFYAEEEDSILLYVIIITVALLLLAWKYFQ